MTTKTDISHDAGKQMPGHAESTLLGRLALVNFILSLIIISRHVNARIDQAVDGMENIYAFHNLSWAVRRFCFNFSEIAVPLFFFFSAMLFYRTYDNSRAVYLRKMKSRFWSLIVPYFIFRTIGYIIKVSKGIYALNAGGYVMFILKHTYTALWFLPELFILAALAPILWHLVRRRWAFIVSLAVSVAICTFCFNDHRHYDTFIYWLPVYMMGAYTGASGLLKCFDFTPRGWHLLIYLAFIVVVWIMPNPLPYDSAGINLAFILLRMMCIPVSVMFFLSLPQIKPRTVFTFSFFMYCFHDFIVIEIFDFSRWCGWSTLTEFVAGTIIASVLTIALAYIIYKYIPSLWKILNGRR